MESLCCSNTASAEIEFYIVEDHITDANKKRLAEIAERYHRNIHFIRMPSQEEIYPGVLINLGRTYCRMALGEILPDSVDRVLSLDCDTLIMDSIESMYHVQFESGEYVAGVYDCVGAAIQNKVLRCPKDIKYCNAGVFLIDLKKWRELNTGKRFLDLVLKNTKEKRIMYFLEQDLMNLVFYGNLKLLPPQYNVLSSVYLFDYDDIIRMKRPVIYYSETEVNYAKAHPAIFHATTCFYIRKRMWVKDSDHPFAGLYKDFRDATQWAGELQIPDKRKLSKKIYAALWHCLPQKAAFSLAAFLINHVRPFYAWITTKASINTIAVQSST